MNLPRSYRHFSLKPLTMSLVVLVGLLISFIPLNLESQELASYDGVTFGIKAMATSSGGLTFMLTGNSVENAEVLDVPTPSRIVIDVRELKSKKNTSLRLSSTTSLKDIRLGSYPDKLRVVLDFGKTPFPRYSIERAAGKLLLNISSSPQTGLPEPLPDKPIATVTSSQPPPATETAPAKTSPSSSPTPSPTQTASPTMSPWPTPSPSATTAASPTSAPTNSPTALPTAIQTSPERTASGPQSSIAEKTGAQTRKLTGISFDILDKAHVLRIMLSTPGEFTLQRRDERTFLLSLPACEPPAEHFELPVFPTQDFQGFSYAMARKNEKEVQIIIGVEAGNRLSSLTKDDGIIVKAVRQ